LYLMFAMEYIPMTQHHIIQQKTDALVAFSVSLIKTVHKMHSMALVLHCDLSPGNVSGTEN
jgi:RIO-like serine/threonine protein kinase